MRLDRYLSQAAAGTRSEVKKIISAGRVCVDGEIVKNPGYQVGPSDCVVIDGKRIVYEEYEYFMLNKPAGVISASRDERGEVCAADLIKDKIRNDVFPVGRLDKDTEGLLLITNNGALSHNLLSPKKHVDKKYFVRLSAALSAQAKAVLEEGIDIGDEKPTLPCTIEEILPDECNITISEGRYHQIKRMFKTQGLEVIYLKRLSMGPLVLDETLKPGEYRKLNAAELEALKKYMN